MDTQFKSIEAEITFLPTAAGGRKTPVKSGYRTQFHFITDNKLNDYTITLKFPDGKDWVVPGDTVIASGSFLVPEIVNAVAESMPFVLREGTRTVATGKVVKKL